MVQSQKMQKYDFKDEETNKNRYLSVTPPEIELENVTVPIVAYYGTDDDLSTVEDAEWALGKRISKTLATSTSLNEIDFKMAQNCCDRDSRSQIQTSKLPNNFPLFFWAIWSTNFKTKGKKSSGHFEV